MPLRTHTTIGAAHPGQANSQQVGCGKGHRNLGLYRERHTAAVVTPVGELRSREGTVPAPASTELTMRLRSALVDIQYGRAEDTFGWMHRVV